MIVQSQPAATDAAGALSAWRTAGARIDAADEARVSGALAVAAGAPEHRTRIALDAAGILAALRLDAEALVAALLLGADADPYDREAITARWGQGVAALMDGARRMRETQALLPEAANARRSPDHAQQLEQLRKMLLAMAQDARVVLLRLAEHLSWMRWIVRSGSDAERESAAHETFELLAPLANRLGVWQVKWELEDLAFRCRDPETYRQIAGDLDEKRADRETFIAAVTTRLRDELAAAGLKGEVTGRPKHIYSIWKKMQRKDLGLADVFDVRAVRVLVDDVKDCYAALGIVHNLWTPFPREFDDYIAKPKANSYRSLHTAVIGPGDKVLEVQIRTHEMHQANELGIAAHWRYKEGGRRDLGFEERIAWLRQVLDWRLGDADSGELAESFRTELFQDTVYVLTPQGRVIDMPRGATPVDFAYHVHSDLGHRCRGAKVNGAIVPLNQPLATGQRVEIIAAKEGGPSRDWLNTALGYLRSQRARAKVRQWFNNQNLEQATAQGRTVLEKEAQRLGVVLPPLESLAGALGHGKVDDMLAAVGRGDVGTRTLQTALRGAPAPEPVRRDPLRDADAPPATGRTGGVLVVGVDRLLTQLSRCCKPAPPDPIIGFVTRGRGVSIHRATCPNVRQLPVDRQVDVQWGVDRPDARFTVDIELQGGTEDTLLRDAADILSREKVAVRAARTVTHGLRQRLRITVDVTGGEQLARVMYVLRDVPGLSGVRRC
jgi:GTP pyrophosphokinase